MAYLNNEIKYVKGVGPRNAKLLAKVGIKTIADMLFYIPRDYINRTVNKPFYQLKINEYATITGKIINIRIKSKQPYLPSSVKWNNQLIITITDKTSFIQCVWFNPSQWLINQFEKGQQVIVSGIIKEYRNNLQITHPDYEILEEGKEANFWSSREILPIYPLSGQLSNKLLRNIILHIFSREFYIPEILPEYILRKFNLPSRIDAIKRIHLPEQEQDFIEARHRFIFEELFFTQLMLARRRLIWHRQPGNVMVLKKTLTTQLKHSLNFELTSAQKRVIREIVDDMQLPFQMNRLLQGDVGSGKTIVALFAMLLAVENGFQSAFMAPTEILATQHYFSIKSFLKGLPVKFALLLGGYYKGKKALKAQVEKGEIDILVGTHSLIQKDVNFHKLGLVVIDEQHRFGVIQRETLSQKGQFADKIYLTATPIPRSLALTVYGDLDVSIIDELPPNRKEVATYWRTEKHKDKIIQFIRNEVHKGRQAYVVCPLVEESEKLDLIDATNTYEQYNHKIFPECEVALLHGRMSNQEKDKIMSRFKHHLIDILVSTTVIEVGIDVPNATIMLIEHSERFGLSQLHQLRGRVGRGEHKSYCILIAHHPISDEARLRLDTISNTNDGFKISEVDLELRGPGEFFGTKQSGLPNFRIANIVRDRKILEQAREIAFYIIQKDPELKHPSNAILKKHYFKYYLKKEKLFSH